MRPCVESLGVITHHRLGLNDMVRLCVYWSDITVMWYFYTTVFFYGSVHRVVEHSDSAISTAECMVLYLR